MFDDEPNAASPADSQADYGDLLPDLGPADSGDVMPDVAPAASADVAPAASAEVAGASPHASSADGGSRRQLVALVVVAFLSIGVGYLFGRTLRGPVAVVPATEFVDAPPASSGAPLMSGDHPLLGQQAPGFTMTDLGSGNLASLADYAGKPLVVNFWATWCPPCRMEMPWLQEASDRHAADGLVVLAVDAGEKVPATAVEAEIRAFVDLMGLTFPILYGPEADAVQMAWGVYGLPSTFLVDREGTIMDAQVGMYPSQASLDSRLITLMAGSS